MARYEIEKMTTCRFSLTYAVFISKKNATVIFKEMFYFADIYAVIKEKIQLHGKETVIKLFILRKAFWVFKT